MCYIELRYCMWCPVRYCNVMSYAMSYVMSYAMSYAIMPSNGPRLRNFCFQLRRALPLARQVIWHNIIINMCKRFFHHRAAVPSHQRQQNGHINKLGLAPPRLNLIQRLNPHPSPRRQIRRPQPLLYQSINLNMSSSNLVES